MDFRFLLGAGGLKRKDSVFDRYTEASLAAITEARAEAERRNSNAITVADLLAGLCYVEGTRADRIGSLKDNASYLRWLAGLPALPMALPGKDVPASQSEIEFDAEAKQALAFAEIEADREYEDWIDTDHLLRGLMCFPNKADFALLKIEFSLSEARKGSRRDRRYHLSIRTVNLKLVQHFALKHATNWVTPVVSAACYLYVLFQTLEAPTLLLAH